MSEELNISEMKVVDLRRELKARNLSSAGDKSELIARLQATLSTTKEDDNLSSESLDSDCGLDDEVEKEFQMEVGKEVVSVQKDDEAATQTKPRLLKRKPPSLVADLDTTAEDKLLSPDSPTLPEGEAQPPKKIILNRTILAPTVEPAVAEVPVQPVASVPAAAAQEPSASKLEMRAKRFNLPPTEEARKEARKQRFGNGTAAPAISAAQGTVSLKSDTGNVDILKKRAERFGAVVSPVLNKVDLEDKLEKRKAKFGIVNK